MFGKIWKDIGRSSSRWVRGDELQPKSAWVQLMEHGRYNPKCDLMQLAPGPNVHPGPICGVIGLTSSDRFKLHSN